MDENSIAKIVVNAAYRIHLDLGPGLLESVYERILFNEIQKKKLTVER